MAIKSSWSGTFELGLISIPMKLYKKVGSNRGVSFKNLNAATGNPVSNKTVDSVTDEPVEEITKGYQLADKTIVRISPDEVKEMLPERTKSMALEGFIPRGAVSVDALDSPYAIRVEPEFQRAYSLVVAGMLKQNVMALCRVVLSTQESLVLLSPNENGLSAFTVHWPANMRDMDSTGVLEVDDEEVELAAALIDRKTNTDFEFASLVNDYKVRVEALAEARRQGQEPDIPVATSKQSREIDLRHALQASLEEA